jgi:hypothetical protein
LSAFSPETSARQNFHNALISLASFLAFNRVTLIDHKKNALMKSTNWKLFGSIAIAMLMIAGCSAPVHVEKDDTVDFSRYKTFAWVDKDGPGKKDRDKSNDIMEQKFKEAVTNALDKQGWRMDNRRPDVLISYDVLVERSSRRQSDAVYSQPFVRKF